MKFTEKEIADLIESEDGNPLAGVCAALLAALKETNAALARREPAVPVVNVSAPASPKVEVSVPAPVLNLTQTRPRMRIALRVTKRNSEGFADEFEATEFIIP